MNGRQVTMAPEITITRVGTTTVTLTPHGDLDLVTAPDLRAAAHTAIDEGAEAMVLDLSDVDFLDSTALGVLVSVHRRLGDRMLVAGAKPAARRIFEITRFTEVLGMYASVDEALVALKG